MPRNSTLKEEQLLKYSGKGLEVFDSNDPFVKFLGYDSDDWNTVWIEYKGKKFNVQRKDLEDI